MKSIRKEMTRNHLILLLVAFIFIASNALVNVDSSRRYNGLLKDYQQVNGLLAVNNRRQTYFKLYSKSHDEGTLKQYYDECGLFDSQLRGLDDKMQNDRKCKMMYRIVGQVAEYRREMAESYIRPDGDYYPSLMADLDEVDLEIERCLNQLMSQYLEYLNTAFASHSRTLGLTNSILIVFFMAASLFGMVLNHQMSTSILNSIKRLTDAAREIMNNNLEAADIEETPYAELNQVSATFDQMKRQIRTMITELHETHQMKERLAEAKIRELQMQMNNQFHRNLRIFCLSQGPALVQIGQGIPDLGAFGLQVKDPAALFFYHMIDCHISSDRHIGHLLLQQLHMPCNILFLRHACKQRAGIYIPGLYVKGVQDILDNLLFHHVNAEGVDFPPFPDHFQKYFRDTAGGPLDVCVRFLHLVMTQHIVADAASGKNHTVALLLADVNDIHGLSYQLPCI